MRKVTSLTKEPAQRDDKDRGTECLECQIGLVTGSPWCEPSAPAW